MANSKFDDTRVSIQKLINVFYNTDFISEYRNVEFEQNILQIVNRKTVENFELFAYVFDAIYDKNFQYDEDLYIYLEKEKNKESNESRLSKLFHSTNDLEDREQTIRLAFSIYRQHQSMIGDFEGLYEGKQRTRIVSDDPLFDKQFFLSDYKYLDITFDIFLSHRYFLRFYNIVVFYVLTIHYGLSVYVDWIFDHSVDRRKLSEETVKLLKYRMKQSKKLVFFNIVNSQTTNWMAWEVGYFSCLRIDSLAILDLDGYCKGNKNVEVLSSNDKIVFNGRSGLYLQKNQISIIEWVQ